MSPLGLTMTPALSTPKKKGAVLNRARRVKQGRRGLTFEVQEVAFSSADGLALADDDGGDHLLSEFGLD